MIVRPFSFTSRRPTMVPRLVIFHSHSGPGTETADRVFSYVEREVAAGNGGVTQPNTHLDVDGEETEMLAWDRVGVHSYKANGFAIGVETADAAGVDVERTPWSQGQQDSIVDIMLRANRRWGIPIQPADNPYGAGMGYHAMWGQNTWLQPTRNPWTKYRGKTCPGAARVAQFPYLIDRAQKILNGPPPFPLNRDQFVSFITMDKPNIGVWDNNLFVLYAQIVLQVAVGQQVPLDGVFDARTYQAVINMQSWFRLTVDGYIGNETWRKIDELAYTNAPKIPQ